MILSLSGYSPNGLWIYHAGSPTFCLTSVELCVMLTCELEKGEDW